MESDDDDVDDSTWWRHVTKTLTALLSFCEKDPPVTMDSHHKGPVMWMFAFSLMLVWVNNWSKSRITCNLRRYDAHACHCKRRLSQLTYAILYMHGNLWTWWVWTFFFSMEQTNRNSIQIVSKEKRVLIVFSTQYLMEIYSPTKTLTPKPYW